MTKNDRIAELESDLAAMHLRLVKLEDEVSILRNIITYTQRSGRDDMYGPMIIPKWGVPGYSPQWVPTEYPYKVTCSKGTSNNDN